MSSQKKTIKQMKNQSQRQVCYVDSSIEGGEVPESTRVNMGVGVAAGQSKIA